MADFETPRILGWIPDPPKGDGDPPDWSFDKLDLNLKAAPAAASAAHLVRDPVFSQGGLGSCVAQTVAMMVYASHRKAGIKMPRVCSRLALYYLSRASHHMQEWDTGTHLRNMFRVLSHFGFCDERSWPYDDSKILEYQKQAPYQKMPPTEAFQGSLDQSAQSGATEYRRIRSSGYQLVDDIKAAIADGYVVGFGTDVSVDFTRNRGTDSYVDPPIGIDIAGGHAMCIAEYSPKGVRGPNSWGKRFGQDGWYAMTWDYITHDMSRDFWIVRNSPVYSDHGTP